MRTQTSRCFAIVPAAGSGSRMKSGQPKQYLPLLGQPLIRHTLAALCAAPVIDRVYVVLSVGDQAWDRHDWRPFGDRLVPLFCGGASRADSVLNGLRAIADDTSESDWILVHDAARPCLAPWHIETRVRELIHANNPRAFYSVEDIRFASEGVFPENPVRQGAGFWLHSLLLKRK